VEEHIFGSTTVEKIHSYTHWPARIKFTQNHLHCRFQSKSVSHTLTTTIVGMEYKRRGGLSVMLYTFPTTSLYLGSFYIQISDTQPIYHKHSCQVDTCFTQ
jgi:hypothetical protein